MNNTEHDHERLNPTIEQLQEEYLLYIAWKKASKYIRYHNWYSDTLELDYQSLQLPVFIANLKHKLDKAPNWNTSKLVHVPAPKSHRWVLKSDLTWRPQNISTSKTKLRPLAHLSLEDQIISTAIMLCIADTVETLQGDPELDFKNIENRKQIVSYGNRLQCDKKNGTLFHRWGNSNLYRLYYKDYQSFLERSEYVFKNEDLDKKDGYKTHLILLDLSKFYDCIRPNYLLQKIKEHTKANDSFYALVENVFNWQWEEWEGNKWPLQYSKTHQIENYNEIALPQGLVSAGFFSNIVLLDFDNKLKSLFGLELIDNILLIDGCRYVDDVRVVVKAPEDYEDDYIIKKVVTCFQYWLGSQESNLEFSAEKSQIANQTNKNKYIVPQSKSATRIQNSVSGTFDAHKGSEIINAIEGFFHTQYKYSQQEKEDNKTSKQQENIRLLVGMSDMRDDTATRFAANKFRRVYRSLRPLVGTEDVLDSIPEINDSLSTSLITKQQLDERAQIFSAMLIDEWVKDPSNIRLLRVALDIYPSKDYLKKILELLKEGWGKNKLNPSVRMIKQYCLSELFRAGAIETGLVQDQECLPDGIDLVSYHDLLTDTANSILKEYIKNNVSTRLPWYLMQQVFLYLFTRESITKHSLKGKSHKKLKRYIDFYKFLSSANNNNNNNTKSIFLTLAYQAFNKKDIINKTNFSHHLFKQICKISPSFLLDVWAYLDNDKRSKLQSSAINCGIYNQHDKIVRLPDIFSKIHKPFLNELNLLKLADAICDYIDNKGLITPWDISVDYENADYSIAFNQILDWKYKIDLTGSKSFLPAKELFQIPSWAKDENQQKKYLLGLILRFALKGSLDSYKNTSKTKIPISKYIAPTSHWEKFRYGNYHGREAFADEWIPLSSWVEELLYELLRWPGSTIKSKSKSFLEVREDIALRKEYLDKIYKDSASKQLFLQQDAPLLSEQSRRLRIAVVQSMLPTIELMDKYKDDDPLLNSTKPQSYLRRHLTCLLEGIEQMLNVRKSHMEKFTGDINLVIFPEIAIHINDIESVLLPFARRHKCLILAGIYYYNDTDISHDKLINTAVWIIPTLSEKSGLSYKIIQQGKKHITSTEKSRFNNNLISFRPAQWIINYKWKKGEKPIRLSASVCYDATDMKLMSDLRNNNHLYIVPAYNRDVNTFDRIAESSHYQMFQGVLMVNNGNFGGSNCYFPFNESYNRQVLHFHGQPQAQIAFIDIDPEHLLCMNSGNFCEKCMTPEKCSKNPKGRWKTPPAGFNDINLTI